MNFETYTGRVVIDDVDAEVCSYYEDEIKYIGETGRVVPGSFDIIDTDLHSIVVELADGYQIIVLTSDVTPTE